MIEITDVATAAADMLRGYHLDQPGRGDTFSFHDLALMGWVIGGQTAVTAVDVRGADAISARVALATSPVGLPRPDVEVAFPSAPGARESGFDMALTLLGMPEQFELVVSAYLDQAGALPIAVVSGRRTPLRPRFESQLQPLIVTSLGRSGSTWLVRLLSEHPEIVAYRPLQYESRVAGSLMRVAHSLASPSRFLRIVTGTDLRNWHWWFAEEPTPAHLLDPELESFLSGENVAEVIDFAQRRVDAIYRKIAEMQGSPPARFFVEKFMPDLTTALIAEVYPQAREIVLVRDPRDMVCSMHAFNAKRRYPAFGRELSRSDEEHVRTHLRNDAEALLEGWRRRRDRALLVRYEDLVAEPSVVLRRIFDWLELEAGPTMWRRLDHALDEAEQLLPELSFHRTTANVRDSVGRWRRDLPEPLLRLCEESFSEFLDTLHYERASY